MLMIIYYYSKIKHIATVKVLLYYILESPTHFGHVRLTPMHSGTLNMPIITHGKFLFLFFFILGIFSLSWHPGTFLRWTKHTIYWQWLRHTSLIMSFTFFLMLCCVWKWIWILLLVIASNVKPSTVIFLPLDCIWKLKNVNVRWKSKSWDLSLLFNV